MSLLEEIQNEAINPSCDLGTLLRKCKILAARLGNKSLEDWLIWESNSYPDEINVPEYRIWPLKIKGNFSGPFGTGLTNADVPLSCLPQEAREKYRRYECRQSIASMEQLLHGNEQNTLQVSTGDLVLILGENVFVGQNCIQAWAEFGVSHIFEVFNSVRNKILDFTLAIWKEDPTAGDQASQLNSSIESSRISQIFNNTVYGGSVNLIGTMEHSQIVHQGDIQSLEKTLRDNDVLQEDIEILKIAIDEDDHPTEKDKFGPKVSEWISKMGKKAAEGIWNIGVKLAGSLLSEIISKYYGL